VRFGYWLILATLVSSAAFGLEVVPSQVKYSALVENLVAQKIQPVLKELEEKEQSALAPVQIKVVPNLIASDIALSLDGGFPRVMISNEFIDGLDAYAEAYVVAQSNNAPDMPEHYFHHYFWQKHPDYSGRLLDTPIGFFQTELSRENALLARKNALLESAVMDIILHELGHHAEAAFYNYKASYFVKQEMEKRADDWGVVVREDYFADLDPLGRLLSIAYVFERDRWSMLSNDSNYPRMINWLADNADPVCEDAEAKHVQDFCQQLQDDLSVYLSDQAETAYRARIAEGEVYATFPLAQLLLHKNRYQSACRYFRESHHVAKIHRASVYLSWCYLNDLLDPISGEGEVQALETSRYAIEHGYMDTLEYIEWLNQNYPIH